MQSGTVYTKSWVLPSTVPAVGEVCRQLLEQIRRQAFEERDAFAAASAIASPSACGREAAFELELELAFEIELTLAAAAAAAAGGDTRAAYSAL